MKPQRLDLSFFLGSNGTHVVWGGKDKWTSDPAVECACGWSTNVDQWDQVRGTGHEHLQAIGRTIRGYLGLVS